MLVEYLELGRHWSPSWYFGSRHKSTADMRERTGDMSGLTEGCGVKGMRGKEKSKVRFMAKVQTDRGCDGLSWRGRRPEKSAWGRRTKPLRSCFLTVEFSGISEWATGDRELGRT